MVFIILSVIPHIMEKPNPEAKQKKIKPPTFHMYKRQRKSCYIENMESIKPSTLIKSLYTPLCHCVHEKIQHHQRHDSMYLQPQGWQVWQEAWEWDRQVNKRDMKEEEEKHRGNENPTKTKSVLERAKKCGTERSLVSTSTVRTAPIRRKLAVCICRAIDQTFPRTFMGIEAL